MYSKRKFLQDVKGRATIDNREDGGRLSGTESKYDLTHHVLVGIKPWVMDHH